MTSFLSQKLCRYFSLSSQKQQLHGGFASVVAVVVITTVNVDEVDVVVMVVVGVAAVVVANGVLMWWKTGYNSLQKIPR